MRLRFLPKLDSSVVVSVAWLYLVFLEDTIVFGISVCVGLPVPGWVTQQLRKPDRAVARISKLQQFNKYDDSFLPHQPWSVLPDV